jgi:ElaB/YqjD/DUF883 family membrane-anchored ribosome-binding protein
MIENTTTNTTGSTATKTNGAASLNSQLSVVQSDLKTLVRDAQSLLQAATALGGEKAEDLRKRGMELLDQAAGKANTYQGQALVKGKELAATADVYVKDNPWRTIAAAAGVGLLLGVILGRK